MRFALVLRAPLRARPRPLWRACVLAALPLWVFARPRGVGRARAGGCPRRGALPPSRRAPLPASRLCRIGSRGFLPRPPCPLARFAPRSLCSLARAFRPLAVGGGRSARPLPRFAVLGAFRSFACSLAPPARPSSRAVRFAPVPLWFGAFRVARPRPCGRVAPPVFGALCAPVAYGLPMP